MRYSLAVRSSLFFTRGREPSNNRTDTPWEKADRTSSEYTRYLAGEIFNLEPWCHFERDALGALLPIYTPLIPLTSLQV